MSYVFFGGMRGTAWVNTFQTVLFLCFGAAALILVGSSIGGYPQAMESLLGAEGTASLLTRERIPPALLPELHVHPAVDHRLPAHHHLLLHRAAECSSSRAR